MQLTLPVEIVRESYGVKNLLTFVFLLGILLVNYYAQVALTEVQNIWEQDVVPIVRVNPAASRELLEIRSNLLILPLVEVWILVDLIGEAAAPCIVNYHMILLQDVYSTFRVKHILALRLHFIRVHFDISREVPDYDRIQIFADIYRNKQHFIS
jgi:hypothetical protein